MHSRQGHMDNEYTDAVYNAEGLRALMQTIDDTLRAGRVSIVCSLVAAVAESNVDTRVLHGVPCACWPARVELGDVYTYFAAVARIKMICLHGFEEAEEILRGLT